MLKRILLLFLLLIPVLACSGCSIGDTDQLYSLPTHPDDELQLQQLLEAELKSGSEYAAPTAGVNMQSVQIHDFDGDGTEEVIVFFRGADQIPKICIYAQGDAQYSLACTITGKGTSARGVDYADLDDDGFSELIVTWQESTGLRLLNVYSLTDYVVTEYLNTNCSTFFIVDLDDDNCSDLITFTMDPTEGSTACFHHFLAPGENVGQSVVRLSNELTTIERLRSSILENGSTALFVEGRRGENNGVITDILVNIRGILKNVTMNGISQSSTTGRGIVRYASDIDRDGRLELPFSGRALGGDLSSDAAEILDWYSYTNDGTRILDHSILHCYAAGWQLIIPSTLTDDLHLASAENAMVLSCTSPEGGTAEPLLTIYKLTGGNRKEDARQEGLFILSDDGSTIYAAELHGTPTQLSRDAVLNSFSLIYTDWNGSSIN